MSIISSLGREGKGKEAQLAAISTLISRDTQLTGKPGELGRIPRLRTGEKEKGRKGGADSSAAKDTEKEREKTKRTIWWIATMPAEEGGNGGRIGASRERMTGGERQRRGKREKNQRRQRGPREIKGIRCRSKLTSLLSPEKRGGERGRHPALPLPPTPTRGERRNREEFTPARGRKKREKWPRPVFTKQNKEEPLSTPSFLSIYSGGKEKKGKRGMVIFHGVIGGDYVLHFLKVEKKGEEGGKSNADFRILGEKE